SPFGVVNINGEIKVPGQGNNAYIFPGLGLGVLLGGVPRITDESLIVAAKALAEAVSDNQINHGSAYAPLDQRGQVSLKIAVALASEAARMGLTSKTIDVEFVAHVEASMYDPRY